MCARKGCKYTKPSTDGNELHPSNSYSCMYDIETHSKGEKNYGDLVDQNRKKIEQKLSSIVKQFQIFFCFARLVLSRRCFVLNDVCNSDLFSYYISQAACQCFLMIH